MGSKNSHSISYKLMKSKGYGHHYLSVSYRHDGDPRKFFLFYISSVISKLYFSDTGYKEDYLCIRCRELLISEDTMIRLDSVHRLGGLDGAMGFLDYIGVEKI